MSTERSKTYSEEELKEIQQDYAELVQWLHEHHDEMGMPLKLWEDLDDMIYRRYEP